MLILKRDPNARYTESYNVLFEGRPVHQDIKEIYAEVIVPMSLSKN